VRRLGRPRLSHASALPHLLITDVVVRIAYGILSWTWCFIAACIITIEDKQKIQHSDLVDDGEGTPRTRVVVNAPSSTSVMTSRDMDRSIIAPPSSDSSRIDATILTTTLDQSHAMDNAHRRPSV
jgi:hypothetical protein